MSLNCLAYLPHPILKLLGLSSNALGMMILQSFDLGQVNNNHSAMHLLALISLFHSCSGRQASILSQDREGERRNVVEHMLHVWPICQPPYEASTITISQSQGALPKSPLQGAVEPELEIRKLDTSGSFSCPILTLSSSPVQNAT